MEAGRLRLRPILMTAFAFILGVLPLMFATGAGAASRQSLGTTVFGGMVAATALTLIFVPVFYALIERVREGRRARRRRPPLAPHLGAAAPKRRNDSRSSSMRILKVDPRPRSPRSARRRSPASRCRAARLRRRRRPRRRPRR